ncbi:MAG: hypothetical protein PHP06_01460 [Clostridia bacterium]|nr:hypothetical protein [Clostridia bacterium]
MDFLDARDVLNESVPKETQVEIAKIIKRSYNIVKHIEKDKDYFDSLLAKNILTYLSSIVVEIQLEKAIKSNVLPYKCSVIPNSANNHYHLEMKTYDDKYIFTVNQTANKNYTPRLSIFRANHSLNNQITIEDFLGIKRKQSDSIYLLITHGHYRNKLNFITIGIPQPYITGWVDKINLLEQSYIVEALNSEEHKEEKIENDIALEIKDLITKRVAKDG